MCEEERRTHLRYERNKAEQSALVGGFVWFCFAKIRQAVRLAKWNTRFVKLIFAFISVLFRIIFSREAVALGCFRLMVAQLGEEVFLCEVRG